MSSISTVPVVIDPYASDQACLDKTTQIGTAYGASGAMLLCDMLVVKVEYCGKNLSL